MGWLKWIGAIALAAALLVWPETAVNAAREAAYVWYKSVAPALFPFMALMPLLTCAEGIQAYEALLGWPMRMAFGLPGTAAPAVVVGMIAGAPAGAHALRRIAGGGRLTQAQCIRIALAVCGMSPAFLTSGVGAAMLGSVEAGRMLLRTQITTQLAMLALLRWLVPERGDPLRIAETEEREGGIHTAVAGVLAVCGNMAVFAVVAAVLQQIFRSEAPGILALCLLEVSSAAGALVEISIAEEIKMVLLAVLVSWNGLCIMSQNMSVYAEMGVKWSQMIAGRILAMTLSAGTMWLQMRAAAPTGVPAEEKILPMTTFFAGVLGLPALIKLAKTYFLTKEKIGKIG